jgi:hypothetical protein
MKVSEFEHWKITAVRKELDQEHEAQVGLKTQLSKDAAPLKIYPAIFGLDLAALCRHIHRGEYEQEAHNQIDQVAFNV